MIITIRQLNPLLGASLPTFWAKTIYIGKRTVWYASHVPKGHEAFCGLKCIQEVEINYLYNKG